LTHGYPGILAPTDRHRSALASGRRPPRLECRRSAHSSRFRCPRLNVPTHQGASLPRGCSRWDACSSLIVPRHFAGIDVFLGLLRLLPPSVSTFPEAMCSGLVKDPGGCLLARTAELFLSQAVGRFVGGPAQHLCRARRSAPATQAVLERVMPHCETAVADGPSRRGKSRIDVN
jgi:hypothetical protein